MSSTHFMFLDRLISQWRVSKVNTAPINIWLIAHRGPPGGKRDNQKQTCKRKGLQITSKNLGRRSAREQFRCSAEFRICHKYNHNTDDCFKNPSKKATKTVDLDLGSGKEEEEENEIIGQEGKA